MARDEGRRGQTGGQQDGEAVRGPLDLLHDTAREAWASTLNRNFDLLLDDEMVLEAASRPLLELARRRRLSPPAEGAALSLLDAGMAVRRLRRAVGAEARP